MHTGHALWLLSIAVTACAGTGAQPVTLPLDTPAQPTADADCRLGPPSPRGLGSRHIERAIAAEAPITRY